MQDRVQISFVCRSLLDRGVTVAEACKRIEQHARTRFSIWFDDTGKKGCVDDLDEFLVEEYKSPRVAYRMLASASGAPVTLSSNFYPEVRAHGVSGSHIVTVSLPPSEYSLSANFLCDVAEMLKAYRAGWTPEPAASDLPPVLFSNVSLPKLNARQAHLATCGLPRYERRWRELDFDVPDRIEWINYWSRETCEDLGFPSGSRDLQLFYSSRMTQSGAWCIQLTEQLLDLEDPKHIDALRAAYKRFSKITE